MEEGKPAGVRCTQLSDDGRCRIFGSALRPAVCSSLRPSADMCGETAAEALSLLAGLERATRP